MYMMRDEVLVFIYGDVPAKNGLLQGTLVHFHLWIIFSSYFVYRVLRMYFIAHSLYHPFSRKPKYFLILQMLKHR